MGKRSLDRGSAPAEFSNHPASHEEHGKDPAGEQGDGKLHITEDIKKAIFFIIDKMEKVKLEEEAIKDDMAGIAAKLGCKPPKVKGMIALVMKERDKGGVLIEEERRLEWAREVLEGMDLVSGQD